jgi:hypothetical protein
MAPTTKHPKSKEEIELELKTKRAAELNQLRNAIRTTYTFLIEDQPCNYTEYVKTMPRFWKAFTAGTATQQEEEYFGSVFWNVSIAFGEHELERTVKGTCKVPGKIDLCPVTKKEQEQRERDMCFSGGLMGCSEETGKCDCLNEPGLRTVRVNPDTAKPDPNGTACFVAIGEQCYISHYSASKLVLPCVGNNLCSSYSQDCVAADGNERAPSKIEVESPSPPKNTTTTKPKLNESKTT